MRSTRDELLCGVARAVGDDGTGDLGVIVDCALNNDPQVTVEEIIEIVMEARRDAAVEADRYEAARSEAYASRTALIAVIDAADNNKIGW